MRNQPFTRPTVVAACEFLERHKQAQFNQVVTRLGLDAEISADASVSVAKKSDMLARIVAQRGQATIDTLDGVMTLAEAVVREAVRLANMDSDDELQALLERGLARDGYVVTFGEYGRNPSLRAALPDEVALPEADDEVHGLLKAFGYSEPLGHLDQAIEAHTRGDWAACNGQLRTFMESLLDHLARSVAPDAAALRPTSENRRQLLAEKGFLAIERNEWANDGKSYVHGLFRMLHTEGSHPGLSSEEHSTFRLHVVLVTARTFLRRLHYGR